MSGLVKRILWNPRQYYVLFLKEIISNDGLLWDQTKNINIFKYFAIKEKIRIFFLYNGAEF